MPLEENARENPHRKHRLKLFRMSCTMSVYLGDLYQNSQGIFDGKRESLWRNLITKKSMTIT